MKPTKLSSNVRLRNLGLLLLLLMAIGFTITIFYSFLLTIFTYPSAMSVRSSNTLFWSDSIDIEKEIPVDVLSRADGLSIAEKTVSVDVSKV